VLSRQSRPGWSGRRWPRPSRPCGMTRGTGSMPKGWTKVCRNRWWQSRRAGGGAETEAGAGPPGPARSRRDRRHPAQVATPARFAM